MYTYISLIHKIHFNSITFAPLKVSWSNSATGSLPRGARLESNGALLIFDRIEVQDQGEYICAAANSAGRADARVVVSVSQGETSVQWR